MKNVFLINEVLIFDPEGRRLGPRAGYPQRAMTLHGPVSECLLQLLEHNGQVLSQRYLFAAVWEKNGAVVTTNALYQTIASIRKTLKSAGLDENIVITLPKEGFKSVAHIRSGTLSEFLVANKTSPISDLAELSSESLQAKTGGMPFKKSQSFLPASVAYGIAGVIFLCSCAVLYGVVKNDNTQFKDYQPLGTLNGCEVYSSWHDKMKSIKAFKALSQRYAIECHAGEMAWMTLNYAQLGSSVIICDRKPDVKNAQCDSIFYRQEYHENE